MSTYSLSGSGTQALSAGTTALHITITTLPAGLTAGRANPTNHFDIGLLRFGDGTGYWAPFPIVGGPEWFGCPIGTTIIGYSLLHGAVISVVEVIGGSSPFGYRILREYVRAIEQKASGSGGGNPTTGAWTNRILNTLADDTSGIASLASNQLTLPAGTYVIQARFPMYKSGRTGCRLRNITDSTTLLDGTSGYTGTATEAMNEWRVMGVIVLAASKAIALQYFTNNSSADGLGLGVDSGSTLSGGVGHEVYAVLEAWKIG